MRFFAIFSFLLSPLCSVLCVLSSVFSPLSSLLCVLSYVFSPMCSLLCVLSSVFSPLSSLLCVFSSEFSPLFYSFYRNLLSVVSPLWYLVIGFFTLLPLLQFLSVSTITNICASATILGWLFCAMVSLQDVSVSHFVSLTAINVDRNHERILEPLVCQQLLSIPSPAAAAPPPHCIASTTYTALWSVDASLITML